eukprot:11482289-Alexandrium_andersonii.AAC.1
MPCFAKGGDTGTCLSTFVRDQPKVQAPFAGPSRRSRWLFRPPAKGPGTFGWAQPKPQALLAGPRQRPRRFWLGPAKGPGALG